MLGNDTHIKLKVKYVETSAEGEGIESENEIYGIKEQMPQNQMVK